MNKLSRRTLASYAADQLLDGKPTGKLADELMAVMLEQLMLDEVDFLLADIAWELERRGKLSIGRVTVARPLTNELKSELKARIKKAVGVDEVLLEEIVDKSVIGGARVETATRVWDETLSRKLAKLREAT